VSQRRVAHALGSLSFNPQLARSAALTRPLHKIIIKFCAVEFPRMRTSCASWHTYWNLRGIKLDAPQDTADPLLRVSGEASALPSRSWEFPDA
jgi:hypothetical protein